HHRETALFLPRYEIPNSHQAAVVILGDNLPGVIMPGLYPTAVTIRGDQFLAVTGERQVVGIPFESWKAVYKLVGGDVVEADARAVVDPIGSLGIGELSALIPDGPGEKPAIGADRHGAPPSDVESAEVFAVGAVPNVGFARLAAGNHPTAVGGDEDLRDGAI